MIRNAPGSDRPIAFLKQRAKAMRRHMLRMSRSMGQGYLAQGLGIADALAAIYFHELRYDPPSQWPERDRFLLSTGHYSIALWAAFAEAGIIRATSSTLWPRPNRLEMSTIGLDARRRDDRALLGHGLVRRSAWRSPAARASQARVFVDSPTAIAGSATWVQDGGRQFSTSTIWWRLSTATASRPTERS